MLVFALYMACLGVTFLFFPNPAITLLGFAKVTDVWIRILGYILSGLSFYYVMAVREEATNFYRWTIPARLPLFPVFLAFFVQGLAPPTILIFGAVDTGCAIWTGLALRSERMSS